LVRGHSGDELWWNPETGDLNIAAWNAWQPTGFVHLAGENIAGHRWTPQVKQRIRDSRVAATEKLVATMLRSDCVPSVFVGASAVGYYGSRGGEILTEGSSRGGDFLAAVCEGWESAAAPLNRSGARVVHLRFGMILSQQGGALARMLPIFRAGLGGRLGSGSQWVSWVSLSDVLRMIEWALKTPSAQGPYNAVSPNPLTNREFTRLLAQSLHRPAVIPAPAFGLRAVFGEMADALLLASQRAVPERLSQQGFTFARPDLTTALRAEK
jgi:uncharacterized protein (TIGR01777 family)